MKILLIFISATMGLMAVLTAAYFWGNHFLDGPVSTQMRAVLYIIGSAPYLAEFVMPYIDLRTESIFWEEIFKIPFSAGYRAAITLAYSIWTDELRPHANPFCEALSMDSELLSVHARIDPGSEY